MNVCRSRRIAIWCSGLLWCVPGIVATPALAADAPVRLKRADAFLGVHFDFHAGKDCTEVGRRTTPEMINQIIDKVRPDYLQIDCKGHPGYSSYPTKVGNPVPGFVGDPLRVWRDATRRRGVALFMHYSGVWDRHAVEAHPEWAARNAGGKPDQHATSVFGPYVDKLMIPQLRELAGEYGVDGVWVDGDCWGATLDYSPAAQRAFQAETGISSPPRKPGEPSWNRWLAFHREGYRRYLRHYVDALRSSHPHFQVISNWAFSDHMPEPVTARVAALSGDFSPDDSVNSARFSGRCLENQEVPWDLMSWSFSRKTRKQKPAAQLMQEAACVLSLGGGYQAYFKQDRDGAIRPAEMDTMAEVAQFCRRYQAFCHRSAPVPQVAILYSTAGHYQASSRLFHPSGSPGVAALRRALSWLLGHQYGVQVVSEHHLAGKMARWPLIVVPDWEYLEPAFRDELAAYGKGGGRLLLVGAGPVKLFQRELAAKAQSAIASVSAVDQDFAKAVERLFPEPLVRVSGSADVDVSPRRLSDRSAIHLVNTSGPHGNAPAEGIVAVKPTGPLGVAIRLPAPPKSIVQQPEGVKLPVEWKGGRAQVTLPQLRLYSILVIEE